MKKKCHESRSKRLKTINLVGLRIDWRDPNNKEDCGVFVMRHMESYLSGGLRNWDCGLDRQNKSQLDRLRLKYVAAILNAENNELRDENISMALEFVKNLPSAFILLLCVSALLYVSASSLRLCLSALSYATDDRRQSSTRRQPADPPLHGSTFGLHPPPPLRLHSASPTQPTTGRLSLPRFPLQPSPTACGRTSTASPPPSPTACEPAPRPSPVIDNQTKLNILPSDGVSSSIPPLHHGRVDMEVVRESEIGSPATSFNRCPRLHCRTTTETDLKPMLVTRRHRQNSARNSNRHRRSSARGSSTTGSFIVDSSGVPLLKKPCSFKEVCEVRSPARSKVDSELGYGRGAEASHK
nr:uncharacterized protein LOC109162486 [Ipomoea batatas]